MFQVYTIYRMYMNSYTHKWTHTLLICRYTPQTLFCHLLLMFWTLTCFLVMTGISAVKRYVANVPAVIITTELKSCQYYPEQWRDISHVIWSAWIYLKRELRWWCTFALLGLNRSCARIAKIRWSRTAEGVSTNSPSDYWNLHQL